jgi:3-oxoacyl-[acyl-carrier protein] reductase
LADGGRIVTVSTGGTAAPLGPDGVYAASKAAGELLTVAAARQLGARGITANIVAPGLTETSGMVLPPEQVQQMTAATPLGRLGQPDDIADVVVFLAGPAARWITGQRIQVSGGLR